MVSKERFYQSLPGRYTIIGYGLFIALFDALAISFSFNRPPDTRRKRLLLVRMDAIGDFVLWLPAAEAIRKLYPAEEWDITLAANQNWSILARQSGIFDHVYPVDSRRLHQNLAYRFRVLHWISRQNFDVAIHPTFSRELLGGDSLVRASKAKQRIGLTGNCSNLLPLLKGLTDRWYTRLIPSGKSAMSELRRNAEFVSKLGGSDAFRLPTLCIQISDPLTLPDKPYFVLFPGASWRGRQWPATHFAEIAARIVNSTGWQTLICGGPVDQQAARELQNLIPDSLNLVGKTRLDQLTVVLANAKLLVSNETSAAHIGSAVGTPTVCLVGGGHFGRFLPYDAEFNPVNMAVINHPMPCYDCNWLCIHTRNLSEPVACIASIAVEDVWQAVCRILEQKPTKAGSSSNNPFTSTKQLNKQNANPGN